MTLDEAIAHEEECEPKHLQLVLWLTELRNLRLHSKRLASDLKTTQGELRDLHRDVGISLDENVHVRVEISRFNKRWQNAHQITSDAFDAPLRGFTSDIDRKANVLRDVIEQVAYETALGFFAETSDRPSH